MHWDQWARRLNLLWIACYTAGLSQKRRNDREAEVKSDMYEEVTYGLATGVGNWSLGREIGTRTMRGAIGDVLWRLESGREAEAGVRHGASLPLPWLTSVFLGGVVVLGAVMATRVLGTDDARTTLGILGILGAASMWLGLYLVTHRIVGPLLIGTGTIVIAWSLWWTLIAPVAVLISGVSGIRRAYRIERLLHLD